MASPPSLPVLIVDFGSQFTQLIARRIRSFGVFCEIVPHSRLSGELQRTKPEAIILSGGPASVAAGDAPALSSAVFDQGVPILGICYGEMILCRHLGGTVMAEGAREFGSAEIVIRTASPLFDGVWKTGQSAPVWMSHGDEISALPHGFTVLAQSGAAPFAAIADESRKIYGLQFHPEVAHTPDGGALLRNFVCKIAGCASGWTMGSFRTESIRKIRAQIGAEHVICGLSGGVDSAVTAILIHEAVGAQLTCILVDHGLMRANERTEIETLFRQHYNIALRVVDAGDVFISALEGVSDPEQKRKIIGRQFIAHFEAEAAKLGDASFLAQGTLYPDVIESVSPGGGPSVTIKSHHNVGGLPERMTLKLVEPLRNLFKDEVRILGRELGLPDSFVKRHPFPGPGLALRCPGAITRQALDIVRKADAIFLEEIRRAGIYDDIWQAFAVLLPVRSVGVMGDARTYEQACVLRAVTASDGMTAGIYSFPTDFLMRTATRIVNEVRGINRVLYDVTTKPPGTIEWE